MRTHMAVGGARHGLAPSSLSPHKDVKEVRACIMQLLPHQIFCNGSYEGRVHVLQHTYAHILTYLQATIRGNVLQHTRQAEPRLKDANDRRILMSPYLWAQVLGLIFHPTLVKCLRGEDGH